jgi:uncharacterized membrane protein (Fun14 family)
MRIVVVLVFGILDICLVWYKGLGIVLIVLSALLLLLRSVESALVFLRFADTALRAC